MLKIKNTQQGPRGVNAISGPVLVDPGQTVEVEVYEREKEHLDASGWFEIKGSYKANPDASSPPPQLANQAAIDKAVAEANDAAAKAAAEKDKEIADLKKQLEAVSKSGK
jgi:hypothetical protein